MKHHNLLAAPCQVQYNCVRTDNLCLLVLPLKKKSWRRGAKLHKEFYCYYKREAAEEGSALQNISPNPMFLNLICLLKEGSEILASWCCRLDNQLVELCPCICSEGAAASRILPSLPGAGGLSRGSITPGFPSLSMASDLPWWWKRLVHGKILK